MEQNTVGTERLSNKMTGTTSRSGGTKISKRNTFGGTSSGFPSDTAFFTTMPFLEHQISPTAV